MPHDALYLLDTNVLIFYSRGQGPTYELIEREYAFSTQFARCLMSVMSIAECEAFFRKQNWGSRKIEQARREVLSRVPIIDITHTDTALMEAYADIDAASQAHPRGAIDMAKNDLWIAATARVLDAILITTDKDFDHLHPQLLTRHYVDQQNRVVVR